MLQAQDRKQIDSILNIVPSLTISEQANLFLVISDEYISSDPDSAVFFSKKAYNIAIELQDEELIASCEFHLGVAYYYVDSLEKSEQFLLEAANVFKSGNDTGKLFNLYNYLTYVYFEKYEYSKALEYQNLSIEIETEMEDKAETASRLHEFGMVYEYTGNIEKALTYYSQSLKLYREIADTERIADLLNNLGNIYLTLSNYQKALGCYLESLNIQKEIQNLLGIAIAENNIGIVYHDWGQYEKALEYYKKALIAERELENDLGIAESILNLAVIFHDLLELDSALTYYKHSLEIAERIEYTNLLAIIYGNIADLQYIRNELDEALVSQEKSLSILQSMGDEISIADAYLMFGQIYVKKKEYHTAINYYKQSLEILEPQKILLSLAECYQGLADAYAGLKEFELAFDYFKQHEQIKDSVFSETMGKRINILEIENRENEIQLLNEERERERIESDFINRRIKIQRVVGIVLIFALLIILSLLALLVRHLKIKRDNLSELKKQHDEIVKKRFELLKAKEKAEESDRLKSAFLVNFSHEIRTPMTGIIGLSQLLKDKELKHEEMSGFAEQIHDNSINLLNLLNNIIDISSIQAGQLTLNNDKILLPALIHETYTHFKSNPEFENPDIEFILNCNCDVSGLITADRQRLTQVLGSIIDNAFKYTEKGEIEICCKIVNNAVQIEVSDTGIGIPEEKQLQIFDNFTQLDYSYTRKYKGTGIGLSLSKALIELMNGTIKVKSAVGEGSTFTIIFPMHLTS